MVASGVNRAAISGSGGPAGVGSGGVPFRRARCFIFLLGLSLGYGYIGGMNAPRVGRVVPLQCCIDANGLFSNMNQQGLLVC